MSYGDLVTIDTNIELDTSNLDQRLDDIERKIDDVEGLDRDEIETMIEDAIQNASLEDRVADLETAATQDGALAALEERLEALEAARGQDATVIDLLRQLARALVG